MTRTHTVVCLMGLGVAILAALVLGVSWGTLISALALLACPAAMYLGMRQMSARPGAGQGIAGRSAAHKSPSTESHAGETRPPR